MKTITDPKQEKELFQDLSRKYSKIEFYGIPLHPIVGKDGKPGYRLDKEDLAYYKNAIDTVPQESLRTWAFDMVKTHNTAVRGHNIAVCKGKETLIELKQSEKENKVLRQELAELKAKLAEKEGQPDNDRVKGKHTAKLEAERGEFERAHRTYAGPTRLEHIHPSINNQQGIGK